jgi:PPOX class probable F420-dependent enzyme
MPRRLTAMEPNEWRAFIEQERTAVLASTGRDGFPHLVAMWYVPESESLLMWTYAKSQKVRNLRRDPRLSALIEAGEQYSELRGVVIQGNAELVEDYDPVLKSGLALHLRYGGADDLSSVRAQAAKRVLIRLPYDKVVSWDHRKIDSH